MLKRFIPALLAVFLCSLSLAGDMRTSALNACRTACASFSEKMSGDLHDVILEKGITGAIELCAERITGMSEEFSQTPGLTIERITLLSIKQQKRQASFAGTSLRVMHDSLAAGMEVPPELYQWTPADGEGGTMVFLKPIIIEPLCLTCHGPAEMVQPNVRDIMQTKYHALPSGNKIGDIKGALLITLELPEGKALLVEQEKEGAAP